MLSDLRGRAVKDSIKFDIKQFNRSKGLIEDVVKALIARDVYSDTGAYNMVINHRDPIFREALKVINDDKRYQYLLSSSQGK